MNFKILVFSLLIAAPVFSQVLIKNTNLIAVEAKKIWKGYDVLCIDGKIVYAGRGRMYKLPANVQVIDGSGKYLMPGFVDAHVHFFQSGGLFARPDAIDLRKFHPYSAEIKWTHDHMEDILRRYLAIGITTVIDVGSTYNFLKQRDSFAAKTYSPNIYMAGPLLTTWVPDEYKNLGNDAPFINMVSEENTRKIVRDQLSYHPDLIKIWYIVTDTNIERGARDHLYLVKAAIDEAHKNNLRVAVHATERITAQLAAEAGADFLVHNIEDEEVSQYFISLLKMNKIVLCPTMTVDGNYDKVFTKTYSFSADELAIAHPYQVQTILDFPLPDTLLGRRVISYFSQKSFAGLLKKKEVIRRKNLKKMLAAGVAIATGTDAGNIGTQHAGSYFEELLAMQKAGASMWQLIQCSTINGARAAGKESVSGSIAEGKQADMLLLNANPLTKLSNWRNILWVIKKGTPVKTGALVFDKPE